MKPSTWLRIASVLTFVHSVLHTIGGVFGKPAPGPATVADAAMRANHFMFMGQMRTYFDFSRGLGLGITIFLTFEAIVFWMLGSLIQQDGRRLRPILAAFAVAYLLFALNSYVYFFSMAAIMEVVIAACLGMAFAKAQATQEPAVAPSAAVAR